MSSSACLAPSITLRQGVNLATRSRARKQLPGNKPQPGPAPFKTVSRLNVRAKGVPCKARKLYSNQKKQREGIRSRISRLEQKTKSCHSSVPPLTSVTTFLSAVPTTLKSPLHRSVDRLKSSVSVLFCRLAGRLKVKCVFLNLCSSLFALIGL